MTKSIHFRMMGYISSAMALVAVGAYFLVNGNSNPIIELWIIGISGIIGTMIGAVVGEAILAESQSSNKK